MIINNFNQLNTKYSGLNPVNPNFKICSYCNRQLIKELWCKECDPYNIIEGWSSGNPDIDKFIKDTMYLRKNERWLEWVPFNRFTNITRIDTGGFSQLYLATWIDGKTIYKYDYGNWKKLDPKPMIVALKKLNGSQNISAEYLNEVLSYYFYTYIFLFYKY